MTTQALPSTQGPLTEVPSLFQRSKSFFGGETFGFQRSFGQNLNLVSGSRGWSGSADFMMRHGSNFGEKAAGFTAKHISPRLEKPAVAFANSLNDIARAGGGGVKGGFSTLGSIIAKAPLKSFLVKELPQWALFDLAMQVGMEGKPLNMRTLVDAGSHAIPTAIGMKLAGHGMKGIARHAGWQIAGDMLGLGPWGSLGLQIIGSTKMPGIGWAVAGGKLAYEGGKAFFNANASLYQAGKSYNKTDFGIGDYSYMTSEAATMRQRAVGAIQKSHMNARAMLGNEASILMQGRY